MPIEAEKKTENIDGVDKDKLVITFSNGALEQLRNLKDFFNMADDESVVKVAISMMQKIKENKTIDESDRTW